MPDQVLPFGTGATDSLLGSGCLHLFIYYYYFIFIFFVFYFIVCVTLHSDVVTYGAIQCAEE